MSPKTVAPLLLGALLFIFGLGSAGARAAADVHLSGGVSQAAEKPLGKHTRVSSSPSLAIVSKPPNNAPDFDYRIRIQEAQALIAKQPVLKDDMQIDDKGVLTH